MGEHIRALREATTLSVDRFAMRAGLTGGHISRIERGLVADPGYTVMSQIAVALGFAGADEMFGGRWLTEEDLQDIYYRNTAIRSGGPGQATLDHAQRTANEEADRIERAQGHRPPGQREKRRAS